MLDLIVSTSWTWILIKFIWLITFLLIVAVVILVLYVGRLRKDRALKEIDFAEFSNVLEEKIVEYLFVAPTDSCGLRQDIFEYLQQMTQEKEHRGIIVSIMIKLQHSISGDLMTEIRKLFVDLGLVEYALEKLKSSNWGEVLGGILQLTEMEVEEADEQVSAFLHHPRSEIRSAVLLYEFRVFQFRRLDSIFSLEHPISEWDQIQFLESIRYFKASDIPNLDRLLSADNPSLVLFGLKLARLFNKRGSDNVLVEILKNENKEVRMEVQWLLAHLGATEAKHMMKEDFYLKDQEEKVCMILALESIIDESDRLFVKGLLSNESEEIRFYAMRAWEKLNRRKTRYAIVPFRTFEMGLAL